MAGAMGWTLSDLDACGLCEFTAMWEGFAALHGVGGRDASAMTAAEAQSLHREFFGDG